MIPDLLHLASHPELDSFVRVSEQVVRSRYDGLFSKIPNTMLQCRDIPTSTNENHIGRYAAVELLMSVPMLLTYNYSLVKAISLVQILKLRKLTKH